MRVEQLDWLAKNPRYTARMANQVGNLCREMTNVAVADLLHLSERTVKDLDKVFMQELLDNTPQAIPRVIGIDEISVGKGHDYRIIVSDIERGRPIWFGGTGHTEADLDQFFTLLGKSKSKHIRLVVMDMWPAFYNSVKKNIPHAEILYDKFHIIRHLSKAMDTVRINEYKRVSGKDRSYIKGHKYTLLSHWNNLSMDSRKTLKALLLVNKKICTAYLLKEEFGQLWDYKSEAWARKFFENWKQQLKWQRLEPFEKFANLVEVHFHGIISHCNIDNKVKLGFVEGLNNKVRVIQRRAYGFHDEEYLKLKILTAFLKK